MSWLWQCCVHSAFKLSFFFIVLNFPLPSPDLTLPVSPLENNSTLKWQGTELENFHLGISLCCESTHVQRPVLIFPLWFNCPSSLIPLSGVDKCRYFRIFYHSQSGRDSSFEISFLANFFSTFLPLVITMPLSFTSGLLFLLGSHNSRTSGFVGSSSSSYPGYCCPMHLPPVLSSWLSSFSVNSQVTRNILYITLEPSLLLSIFS